MAGRENSAELLDRRLPYDLVCDGEDVDLGKVKYLLSPQDLAAYALVPALIAAGVSALKIEGRLKKPEYVANITRHYRVALDAALAGQPVRFEREQVEEMELSFSRGFSPGWLEGNDHKRLVPGLSSAKRGVPLGRVKRLRGRRVVVEVPRRHEADFGRATDADIASASEALRQVLGRLATLDGPPYNLVLHTAPLREQVDATYHWHWEIHPRLREIAGLELGTGLPVNPVSPEDAVAELLSRAEDEAESDRRGRER